jgi:hypothetical protein
MPSMSGYLLQIALNADGSLAVMVEATDGGVACTKKATVSGSTASFDGQSCPLVFNGSTLTETFTHGTFTVIGNTLMEVGQSAVAGTVPDDGGNGQLRGDRRLQRHLHEAVAR